MSGIKKHLNFGRLKKDKLDMAEEHAKWYSEHFGAFAYQIFHDTFLHGYKHGEEDKDG